MKTFTIYIEAYVWVYEKKGNEAVENEYITFNQIPYPEKTDKLLLLELLNLSFLIKFKFMIIK